MKGSDFFYAFNYQIQMQFRCNWHGSFRDKDDWEVILLILDEMKSVIIPYINIRIIQRPILCTIYTDDKLHPHYTVHCDACRTAHA